jgi:hypothetical protein
MALSDLKTELAAVRKAILEITESGSSSVSVSAAGGSESWTRLDLDKLYRRETDLVRRIRNCSVRTRRVVKLHTGWTQQ